MTGRRTLIRAGGFLLALAAAAAAGELEDAFEAKLEKDFAKNAEWTTDFDAAKARAKEAGKPIFAYFTRSYSP